MTNEIKMKMSAREAAEKAIVDDATIERFGKQPHCVNHSFDKNGRNVWSTGFKRISAKEAAELVAYHGWTLDEYVAAKTHWQKKVDADYEINAEKSEVNTTAETIDAAVEAEIEIVNNADEIAEINAADVKVNVAQGGKVIEQIKVDVDTAINIITRLNYRNDTFVYSNTTRYDNADIQCRHFDAYKADGEKDAFAITEYVINGKLEIVRFFNLFRDITVDLQIGNVNYTIGDKGAIVLTDAEEIVEETPTFGDTFHVFEIGKTYFCSNNIAGKALIRTVTVDARTDAILTGTDNFGITRKYHIDNAVNSEVVSLSEDIDAPKIYAGFEYSDAVKAVSTDNYSRFVDEVAAIFGEKKIADKPADTVDTPPVKKSFELTVNNERVFFIDGKFDSVFSYTYDAGFATEYSNYYYFERINQKHGCVSRMKLIDDEEEFFALMVERGACTIDGGNPDNEPDDKQAKKEMARKLTDYLNGHYEQRLRAGYKPITPYATCDVRYQKLHPVARWTVGYDSVNDTFGIWSEYGCNLGHEFCGWYKISKLAVIIIRLTTAIDNVQSEFYFEDTDTLSKRTRRGYGKRTRLCYGKWRQIQAANLKDKIDRDAQGADEDNVFSLLPALDELNDVDIDEDTPEIDPAEYAINAEGHNAKVASGNYSVDINGEYVRFENYSIVRIDAMRKMNWIYDHTGANKIFRYGNRKSSAAKVIDMYMNGERADEQGKYFHEFFDQYCKTCGDIVVLVELTYADDREHHFMAEFNQGRLADKFIADVKELAGDTPCQIFKKYRDNHIKPVWEDPHKYETVGNLEHARHLYGEETVGDIAPDECSVTQEAFDEAVEAEEFEALFAKWTAEILSDPRIEAAYRKARERVEVEFTSYGVPLYTYIKKNGERCYEDFVAKSYITKCGLSETDFIVKARAEAKITRDRRTEKIGDDEVYYVGGKWQCTYSAKYHASFFRGINSGELMYRVDDLTIVNEQDFWQAMIERGACTIDNDLTEAEDLTAELKDVTRKSKLIDIYPQVGGRIVDNLYNVEIRPDSDGFIFTNVYETLARYDTKEQCQAVIEQIKTAVDFGDNDFTFPQAADVELELKLPALMIEQFNKYRYRAKGRSIPRRFLAADLKYYGLSFADLRAERR